MYPGEEPLSFRADARNPKKIREESPKHFLGFAYLYEILKVLSLGYRFGDIPMFLDCTTFVFLAPSHVEPREQSCRQM